MTTMKTLDDVKHDMSSLFEAVKAGQCDLKVAAELANITGKYLKAAHLELARDVFLSRGGHELKAITHDDEG